MAKALIIKGANFAENKVATIDITDPVYCTGISLNKSATTLTGLGATETLTATVTPADTMDTVIWSSSDTSVVTVANGVVTLVGVGTATVTATCGQHSAACAVTAKVYLTGAELYPDTYCSGNTTYSGGNGYMNIDAAGSKYGAIAATGGDAPLHKQFKSATYYPVKLPGNAKRVKVTYSASSIQVLTMFWCSQAHPNESEGSAQLIDKIAREDIVISDDVSIINIPSYEGFPAVDSVVIALVTRNDSQFLESYFDTITIEALPAA